MSVKNTISNDWDKKLKAICEWAFHYVLAGDEGKVNVKGSKEYKLKLLKYSSKVHVNQNDKKMKPMKAIAGEPAAVAHNPSQPSNIVAVSSEEEERPVLVKTNFNHFTTQV